jgi:4,5-dihydroxyphthalate decarboxylase
VALYTQTAAIWIRGHLRHQFGVDLDSIEWVEGAVDKPGAHGEPRPLALLRQPRLTRNTQNASLTDLLARGEIDALIGSRRPAGNHPDFATLFADPRAVERAFVRETGIFPIMHLVAIRRDVIERAPWVAASLYKAFCESKAIALRRLRFAATNSTMLPWQMAEMDEVEALFGGDAFPYGVEANRRTLDALVQYMAEQGFIAHTVPAESLFVPLSGIHQH